MIINLDLIPKELNINEYLTLFKLNELSKNNDIPFNSSFDILKSLELKDFIKYDEDDIKLTTKGNKLFKIDSIEEDITEVINYFKKVTDKKISEVSPSNRKFVKDRLNEGYTTDDLKAVIDVKNKEWSGTSMDMYIRIQTLFNDTKFQKYITEINKSSKKESVAVNVRRI